MNSVNGSSSRFIHFHIHSFIYAHSTHTHTNSKLKRNPSKNKFKCQILIIINAIKNAHHNGKLAFAVSYKPPPPPSSVTVFSVVVIAVVVAVQTTISIAFCWEMVFYRLNRWIVIGFMMKSVSRMCARAMCVLRRLCMNWLESKSI